MKFNKEINKLVETGVLIPGIYKEDSGFIVYRPINIEEFLEKVKNRDTEDLAYNTQSMGRGIFTIKDGKFINYKGVDSQMKNSQTSMIQIVSAKSIEVKRTNLELQDENCFKVNMVIFPGERPDIRIRGCSPLDDLEYEILMHEKMASIGIKQPKILELKELTQEFCLKYGLPIKIDENEGERQRPETMKEYFIRTGILEDIKSKGYSNEYVFGFVNSVDNVYTSGQRYGQMIREVENPYRVSDLQMCINNGNIEQIQLLLKFSQEICGEEKFSTYFSKTLGESLANLMNNGWIFNQFVHKQDISLAGEFCDDEYDFYPDKVREEKETDHEEGKKNAIIESHQKKYILQIYSIIGCLKTVSDAYSNIGIEVSEDMLDAFTETFLNKMDFEKAQNITDIDLKSKVKGLSNTDGRFIINKLETINPKGNINEEVRRNFART